MTPTQFTTALKIARERGMIPSALGSAALQERFVGELRRRVLVLARVTNARFLSEVKRAVEGFMAGELGRSKAQGIAFLKETLQRLGYTPETGFPGDAAKGVPSAEAGSLQDLSSWKRLELVFNTERALANGQAQKLNSETPVARRLFPARELVRLETRQQPRGSIDSGSPGWAERWIKMGAKLTDDAGKLRMIAGLDDEIWGKLGSQAELERLGINDLALGVDYPPFCIRSGFGWVAVSKAEALKLKVEIGGREKGKEKRGKGEWRAAPLPDVKGIKTLDPQVKQAMLIKLNKLRALSADLGKFIKRDKQGGQN
jgi:hypothetical protein